MLHDERGAAPAALVREGAAGAPAERPWARRTDSTRAKVMSLTFCAPRCDESTSALRPFKQMRILLIIVATGLVTGSSPSTTPTGLATSVTPRSSVPSAPRATRDANTPREAK